jgi:hypothetical protein
MDTTIAGSHIVNKPRKVIRNALVITAMMTAGAFITAYSGMDGMKGGYALIFIFAFLAMSSFVTAMVYIPRAREFDRLVNEMKPLAHWTYSDMEWNSFIKEDLKETIAVNKATLRLVIIVSLVVLAGLLLVYKDNLFILIIAGIIGMLTITAFVAPRIRSYFLKKGEHEALVGERAAIIGGTFQTWTQLGAYLIGTDIYEESEIPVLHIIYEFPTLQSTQQEIVRIPVPKGKMEEARKIIEILKNQIK